MDTNDDLAQLEELLCDDLDIKKDVNAKEATIQEINIFDPNSDEKLNDKDTNTPSVIHNGDTDSSDDEERRNYTERKYSDYGTLVKKSLDHTELEKIDKRIEFESRLRQANIETKVAKNSYYLKKPESPSASFSKHILAVPDVNKKTHTDIFTDPVFGIRVSKPLISNSALLDRMQGREAVNMLRVKRYVENEDLKKDWVIGGVIVKKSATKKSQKGNQFIIWTLSDLKDDLKTVSMFLFRKAYNDLWKTSEGTVVAVLNPNVLDRSENSKDQACLSVDNPDRVMIIGQSKDLGICKSKKKSGEACTAFVNLSQGEHCIYHIKQEYQKFSRRQELQSSTMGKGLTNLQNKVFGKNTFIYGGKSYSALPSGNSKPVKERDQNRLMSLSDYYKSEGDKLMINKAPCGSSLTQNKSGLLHSPTTLKISDAERLTNLNKSPCSSPSSLAERVASSPTLGKGISLKNGAGVIDLNISYRQRSVEKAKMNALKLVQRGGGIEKQDPNNIKGTEAGKKRALEKLLTESEYDENTCKKAKTMNPSNKVVAKPHNGKQLMSERFKKILEATSAHENLIRQHEDNEQEKYFNKLEKKEAMEEKMLNTFKIACKAVRCVKCKYTSFSAAQICKDERHPLKLLDTFKRFFKCADCKNRTVSLELLPLHSCSNCNGSRWEKAPMLREKNVTLTESLSIRGEEESFIGGQVNAGKNINLLVPDS